jgi:Fe-S cluster assembly protein SufD
MDYIEIYRSRIEQEAPTTAPFIQAPRAAALEQFQRSGFPVKGNEKYKYTALNVVFEKEYQIDPCTSSVPLGIKEACGKYLPAIDATYIYTINGVLVEGQAQVCAQIKGLIMKGLAEASTLHADLSRITTMPMRVLPTRTRLRPSTRPRRLKVFAYG